MTISNEDELELLKAIGRIVAKTLNAMGAALEPGMTTAELDAIGRKLLEQAGAEPAPESSYGFPGATCISINEEVAHGIPGARVIAAGDLVNIDVSASRDGVFADTGASFAVPPVTAKTRRLCRDGKRALWKGIAEVRPGRPLSRIGDAIGAFAKANRYTLVRNLASHGVGRSLHEYPTEIATWSGSGDRRTITEGMVFTIEPFLSRGALWAQHTDDPWTLLSEPHAPTVQYEHTLVATRSGAMVVTAAS